MKLRFKKLNSQGFAHHLLIPVMAIVVVAGIGTYVVTQSHANPATKPSGGGSTSSVFTVLAKDMNGDGQGPVSLVTSGKGRTATTYQELPVGSKAGLVNSSYSATQTALNSWSTSNAGKNVKFCVTAMSGGTYSSLWFNNSNNLGWTAADGTYNEGTPPTMANVPAATSFSKYCSPVYKINTTSPPNGTVTFTIHMLKCQNVATAPNVDYQCSTPVDSGPMRVLSASYELQ